MPVPDLEARAVSRIYPGGVTGLDDVSLSVGRGEAVALIGESGSGKSTLLRCFNRLDEPTAGSVWVQGRPAAETDPVELRRRTGYVPQDGGLLPHWTVSQNVSLVPELLGWDPVRRRRRVAELLDLVGLSAADHAERYPVELSGGQRQRVAVARALAADPHVVLLDEPFGALDPITRAGLQKEFAALRRAVRKTMLLVTHDLAEAFRLADRIAVLRGGRLLQIGTAEDLVRRPADEYVRALVAHAEPAS